MKKVCCNCKHNIRSGEIENIKCHCEVDGHYIGYCECFEQRCEKWEKETTFELKKENET